MSGLLGHTNISTTLRYAMATDPMKVSAIGAIPGLEWEAVGSKFRVKYATARVWPAASRYAQVAYENTNPCGRNASSCSWKNMKGGLSVERHHEP